MINKSLFLLKELPQIKIHYFRDESGPPFLTLRHVLMQLEYPDGTFSEKFVHDVVERENLNAVVICAYVINDGFLKVWLRSCVRPALAKLRVGEPSLKGNGWELPAGLIDSGEEPTAAAIRELREEVGFDIMRGDIEALGAPIRSSVGLAGETLHFYAVNVSNFVRGEPLLDGSPIEKHGKCLLVSADDIIESGIGDLKTELGIFRLKEKVKDYGY